MARRRMISQDIIFDENYNSISIEAQNIFVRLLTISDDCGVVPANPYRLNAMINTPERLKKRISDYLREIVAAGLGFLFEYNNDSYFSFKLSRFQDFQSYILKKATKSEYLRISVEDFIELSKKFQELPRNSDDVDEKCVSTVESIKQKVESKELKAKSKIEEKKRFGDDVYLTEDEVLKLTNKLGSEKRFNRCIEILDAYLGQSDKNKRKYTCHYKVILNWVISKLEEEERKAKLGGGYTAPAPKVESDLIDFPRGIRSDDFKNFLDVQKIKCKISAVDDDVGNYVRFVGQGLKKALTKFEQRERELENKMEKLGVM